MNRTVSLIFLEDYLEIKCQERGDIEPNTGQHATDQLLVKKLLLRLQQTAHVTAEIWHLRKNTCLEPVVRIEQ